MWKLELQPTFEETTKRVDWKLSIELHVSRYYQLFFFLIRKRFENRVRSGHTFNAMEKKFLFICVSNHIKDLMTNFQTVKYLEASIPTVRCH